MNGFTQGPWAVNEEKDDGTRLYVRTGPSNPMCQNICRVTPIIEGSSRRWAEEDMSPEWRSTSAANARLIAAAPEMLKALEDLLIYMGLNGDDHCPQFDAGVAAVKKARHG